MPTKKQIEEFLDKQFLDDGLSEFCSYSVMGLPIQELEGKYLTKAIRLVIKETKNKGFLRE